MSTVRDLIRAALLDIGVIASGEAMTADEASDSLRRLNLMLQSWNLERLVVYVIDEVQHLLTGATSYTWGLPGGAIASVRPVRLEQAALRLPGTSPALDIPVQIVTDQEYHALDLKALAGVYPSWVYLAADYPLATLYVWPADSGSTLVLWPWHQLSSFPDLDATVSFPPGYELAVQSALSLHLASMFRDCTPSPYLVAVANESKALLKVANSRPNYLSMPDGIPSTGQYYSIYSDGYR